MDDSHDRLWKMQDLFKIQRVNSKFYIPSQHLAVDEVVKLRGRVIFKPYIPQKRNISASECTNYVTPLATHMYLGKDRQQRAQSLTAPHATMTDMTRRVEGFGHKLYTDNNFSSPGLSCDMAQKKNLLLWDYKEGACPRN
jgi:hypothetical protein